MSLFGVPIAADECIAKLSRVSYARLLIEIDVSKALPHSAFVEDEDGKVYNQAYYAEWVSYFCQKCQVVGYICDENRTRTKKSKNVVEQQQTTKQPVVQAPVVSNNSSSPVAQVDQVCEVEEGEWIQVTGNKNKGKAANDVCSGGSGSKNSVKGAGIPLNPILGE